MKADYYVKADGTICMTYPVFRALNAETVQRLLTTRFTPPKQPTEKKTLKLHLSL